MSCFNAYSWSARVPWTRPRGARSARATITHVPLLPSQRDAHPGPGVLRGDDIVSLRGAGFPDLLSVLAGGADALDRVQRWLHDPRSEEHTSELQSLRHL